jgi:hypothetical protein
MPISFLRLHRHPVCRDADLVLDLLSRPRQMKTTPEILAEIETMRKHYRRMEKRYDKIFDSLLAHRSHAKQSALSNLRDFILSSGGAEKKSEKDADRV